MSRSGSVLPWILGLGALAAVGVVYAAHKAPEPQQKAKDGKPDAKASQAAGAPPPPPPLPPPPAKAPKASPPAPAAPASAAPKGFVPPPGATAQKGLEMLGAPGSTTIGGSGGAGAPAAQGDPGYIPEGGGSGNSFVKVTNSGGDGS